MMILIVCSSELEDTIIAMGDDRMITPGEAKKYLEELVARRNPDLAVIDSVEVDPDKTVIFEEFDDKGWSVALVTWIENLC